MLYRWSKPVVPNAVPAGAMAPPEAFMCACRMIWASPAPGTWHMHSADPGRMVHGWPLPRARSTYVALAPGARWIGGPTPGCLAVPKGWGVLV